MCNTDGLWRHSAKWSKSKERQILYDLNCMLNLKYKTLRRYRESTGVCQRLGNDMGEEGKKVQIAIYKIKVLGIQCSAWWRSKTDLTSSVHLSCVHPLQQSSPGKQPCSRSLTPAALRSPAGRAVPENLSGQRTSRVPCGLRASSAPGCSSQHLLGSQHSHTLSATDGLLSPARAASTAAYMAGPPWILTVVMGWTGVWLQVTWPSCTRPHLSTAQMIMGGKQTGDKADCSPLRWGFTEKVTRPCHSLS